MYTIARVCAFRDNTLPYQDNRVALKAGYGNWRDEEKLRWLDPDSETARAYIVGLCGSWPSWALTRSCWTSAGSPPRASWTRS